MDEEELKKYKKLSPVDARLKLQMLNGWEIENGRLEKEYHFKDFVHGLVFLNKIVNPIEENQNYPQIGIRYNLFKISLFNNAAGALTVMDFDMAKEFDELAGPNAIKTPS